MDTPRQEVARSDDSRTPLPVRDEYAIEPGVAGRSSGNRLMSAEELSPAHFADQAHYLRAAERAAEGKARAHAWRWYLSDVGYAGRLLRDHHGGRRRQRLRVEFSGRGRRLRQLRPVPR